MWRKPQAGGPYVGKPGPAGEVSVLVQGSCSAGLKSDTGFPQLVMMVMGMLVGMLVVMIVVVAMSMTGAMVVIMMVDALAGPRAARVLAEYQRLDGHRHSVRRHADSTEIDIVKIPQHDAVDHQDLAFHPLFFAQDRAQRLRDVAVQHDIQRLSLGEPFSHRALDAFGESGDPLIRGRAQPTESQRHFNAAVMSDVERSEMITDRGCKFVGLDDVAADVRRLHYLQVAPRQQRARTGNEAGIAAELHA